MPGELLIALDLDGTLEDSRDDMVAAVLRIRAAFGLPERAGAEFRDHVNRGMPHLYEVCFAELLATPEAHARARAAYVADYSANIADKTRLYPGMAEALAELATIGPLAIVTNKPEGLSELLLTALGVRNHFAAVIGGDTCAEPKPSPLPLRTAAARAGVDASGRVFMIGDSPGDIRCGRAAEATVIWCAWGYKSEPGPIAPDHVARDPRELSKLVRAALSRSSA